MPNSNSFQSDNRWSDEDWDDVLNGAGDINNAQQIHKRVHHPFLDWMNGALLDPQIGDWIHEDVTVASICMSTQALNDQFPDHAEVWHKWAEDEQGDEPSLSMSHAEALAIIRAAFMLGIIFSKDYSEGKVDLGQSSYPDQV